MKDLFENPELLPIEVQNLINEFEQQPNNYESCAKLVKDLNKLNYTCDYGLDAVPYHLSKLVKTHKENLRVFKATCSDIEITETDDYFYKVCPFGELRYWKATGRISTANLVY